MGHEAVAVSSTLGSLEGQQNSHFLSYEFSTYPPVIPNVCYRESILLFLPPKLTCSNSFHNLISSNAVVIAVVRFSKQEISLQVLPMLLKLEGQPSVVRRVDP